MSKKKKINFVRGVINEYIQQELPNAIDGEIMNSVNTVLEDRKHDKEILKSRIGYNIEDLDEFGRLIRFKNQKKLLSKKFSNTLIAEDNKSIIQIDNSQNEMRIFASYPTAGIDEPVIVWIGKTLLGMYRNSNNIYTIITEKIKLKLDVNLNEILSYDKNQ